MNMIALKKLAWVMVTLTGMSFSVCLGILIFNPELFGCPGISCGTDLGGSVPGGSTGAPVDVSTPALSLYMPILGLSLVIAGLKRSK